MQRDEADRDWPAILDKLERVKALIDRAGTPAEAEAAAAALTKLLAKHDLTVLELERRLGARPAADEAGMEHLDLGAAAIWRRDLLSALALHHGCRAAFMPGTDRAFVVGEARHVALVRDLYATVLVAIERMADAAWAAFVAETFDRHGLDGWSAAQARAWKRNYRIGFVDALAERLQEERLRAAQEVAGDGGSALVALADERANEAFRRFFPKVRAARPAQPSGYGLGLMDGMRDGARFDPTPRPKLSGAA